MNNFYDDFLEDDTDYKQITFGKDYFQNDFDDMSEINEDSHMNPLLSQPHLTYESMNNETFYNDDMNENDEYLENEMDQFSGEDNFEMNKSSSSGHLSADGNETFGRRNSVVDKRHFSNEMERQRRKQYSESLKRVQEVLPSQYIKLARENLGRKNMKKVSYQVLLHALCAYLTDDVNQKTDCEELRKQLKTLADEIKKQYKNKSHLLDENFKNTITHFIQQANNLMCSK